MAVEVDDALVDPRRGGGGAGEQVGDRGVRGMTGADEGGDLDVLTDAREEALRDRGKGLTTLRRQVDGEVPARGEGVGEDERDEQAGEADRGRRDPARAPGARPQGHQ